MKWFAQRGHQAQSKAKEIKDRDCNDIAPSSIVIQQLLDPDNETVLGPRQESWIRIAMPDRQFSSF